MQNNSVIYLKKKRNKQNEILRIDNWKVSPTYSGCSPNQTRNRNRKRNISRCLVDPAESLKSDAFEGTRIEFVRSEFLHAEGERAKWMQSEIRGELPGGSRVANISTKTSASRACRSGATKAA